MAFSICSKSKPSWTRNFWSSAAMTATPAWREMRSQGTHWWRCCSGGSFAAMRSLIMNAVTGTGSQRNAATARMLATVMPRRAVTAHRANRAGRERFMGCAASGGAGAPCGLDEHGLRGHVVVPVPAPGLHLGDLVDHL